jgi:hypothetical protein
VGGAVFLVSDDHEAVSVAASRWLGTSAPEVEKLGEWVKA